MDDVIRRVRELNPVPNDAELPTGMWSAVAVLESVDDMSGAGREYQRPAKPATQGWRTRWVPAIRVAAAAFAVVIVIGIAVALFAGGEDRGAPVDQPIQTTVPLPTTAPPTTTSQPTTSPETTGTAAFETELVTVARNIPYSGTQLLDVWAPTSPGPWPVLVVLHGVAVTDNTRSGYDPLAENIATGGAVVYNVEWPTSGVFVKEARIVACAVGYARATAADYGGSPDRVTLLGHSNGGSMGATVALAAELLDPIEDCAATDASIVPDALVGVSGDYSYAISGNAAFLQATDPAAWEIIDPYTNIGRNPDLDVYLLHGAMDEDVSVQSAIDFDQALRDAGYEVSLTVLEGVGHNSPVAPTFDAFQETVAVALEALRG